MAQRFAIKAQTFKDIKATAQRQSKAYTIASDALRNPKKIKAPDVNLDSQESGLKSLLRININLSAADWNAISDFLSNHLATIAERYRTELLVLVVYIRRTIESFHQRETSLALLIVHG